MTQRQPLSPVAYAAVKVTAARAQSQGLDVWEELNRIGLLATESRIHEIHTSALRNMQERFVSMSADDLMRHVNWQQNNSNPATPADLLRAITQWLDSYIDRVECDK